MFTKVRIFHTEIFPRIANIKIKYRYVKIFICFDELLAAKNDRNAKKKQYLVRTSQYPNR